MFKLGVSSVFLNPPSSILGTYFHFPFPLSAFPFRLEDTGTAVTSLREFFWERVIQMRVRLAIRELMIVIFLSLVVLHPSISVGQSRGAAEWTRVDSIVAAIDGEPVLESDILMEIDFGLLVSSQPGSGFGNLLEAYLNRRLILMEVEEVGGFRLTVGQAEGAYQGYLLRYESRDVYEKKLENWGIGEEEVLEMLRRALLASLYTESRIQFYVNILPSDIEKAYEEDRERWGETTIYEAWETIRSELLQSTYRRERDRWLSSLRDRYDLKVLNPNGEWK